MSAVSQKKNTVDQKCKMNFTDPFTAQVLFYKYPTIQILVSLNGYGHILDVYYHHTAF